VRLSALLLFLALIPAALAEPRFPALSGRVVDQAQILSPQVERKLDQLLAAHESETSNQVVVASVASLEGYDIADYAVRLGRAWALGQKDRDNGALLLVAPNEREVRIEVGYGLEGALPDATAFSIVQNEILPRFRRNDYDGGALAGVAAILGAIEGEYQAKPAPRVTGDDVGSIVPLLMLLAFLAVAFMNGRGRRGRGRWLGPLIAGGMLGGRRRGGGFGGGFRGGGGSFGGGGASGRW
jgi:uncharacterized protein